MQMAIIEFKEYALIWWAQLNSRLRDDGIVAPTTWRGLLAAMDARFIPCNYRRE